MSGSGRASGLPRSGPFGFHMVVSDRVPPGAAVLMPEPVHPDYQEVWRP